MQVLPRKSQVQDPRFCSPQDYQATRWIGSGAAKINFPVKSILAIQIRIYEEWWADILEYICQVHVSVHIIAYIQFNTTNRRVELNLYKFTCAKLTLTYIRYYMAAKLNFTGKTILAAPDLTYLSLHPSLPSLRIDIFVLRLIHTM